MSEAAIRLDASVRIPVLTALRAVNAALLELLAGFDAGDWARPTIHQDRSVKDLAAHLLHGSIRRVSVMRDGYTPPGARPFSTRDALTRFIQEDNRLFMQAMSQVSPRVLCELIETYDPEMVRLFEARDPDGPGLGVVWAGEWQSPNWFDLAREYTEKWHHQQQLRDATGRPPLYDPVLLVPVLDTFARGLPFAYRDLRAPDGVCISIAVDAPAGPAWTLRRAEDGWSLWSGLDDDAVLALSVDADQLWRLWTKGLDPAEAARRMRTVGDRAYAQPLLEFVAIMA